LPYYSVLAADTLLYAVTLTFDLEHLQHIACDVMKLCTKFERNLAIRGNVPSCRQISGSAEFWPTAKNLLNFRMLVSCRKMRLNSAE